MVVWAKKISNEIGKPILALGLLSWTSAAVFLSPGTLGIAFVLTAWIFSLFLGSRLNLWCRYDNTIKKSFKSCVKCGKKG